MPYLSLYKKNSVNPQRITENIGIFDFTLSEEEMKEISQIDKNHRYLRPNDWYGIPLFGDF